MRNWCNLIFDTLYYWQPMKSQQQRYRACTTRHVADGTHKAVLDALQLSEVVRGSAVEDWVAVVKSCIDDAAGELVCRLLVKHWSYVSKSSDMAVAVTTNVNDMLIKFQWLSIVIPIIFMLSDRSTCVPAMSTDWLLTVAKAHSL